MVLNRNNGKGPAMDGRFHIGFILILTGIVFILAGLLLLYTGKIPLPGRLPGDISIYGKRWSFHFPIVTGLVISLLLTIIINFLFRR